VPLDVLREVENGSNSEKMTREAVDRAVSENQFMNGKIWAVQVRFRSSKRRRKILREAFHRRIRRIGMGVLIKTFSDLLRLPVLGFP
jgi:hypothetical protein